MSEFDLIRRLRERLPTDGLRIGSGDDAAVSEPAGATATSVDAIVEGVHFTLIEFPPAAIGHKALAAALSDLAAMGAKPGEAYVVLGLPDAMEQEVCEALADGLAATATDYGVTVAGGDVTRAPALFIAVTVVGHEPPGARLVSRAGAKPGDIVAVTGELGGAAAGLVLLQEGPDASGGPEADALRARQLAPRPRIDAGLALAAAGATAMIDISDGLGADAAHLAESSRVQLELDLESVPIQPGATEEQATSGGEDFELLVTLPPDRIDEATAAVESTGVRLIRIGLVGEGSGAFLRAADGSTVEPSGFDHFA